MLVKSNFGDEVLCTLYCSLCGEKMDAVVYEAILKAFPGIEAAAKKCCSFNKTAILCETHKKEEFRPKWDRKNYCIFCGKSKIINIRLEAYPITN